MAFTLKPCLLVLKKKQSIVYLNYPYSWPIFTLFFDFFSFTLLLAYIYPSIVLLVRAINDKLLALYKEKCFYFHAIILFLFLNYISFSYTILDCQLFSFCVSKLSFYCTLAPIIANKKSVICLQVIFLICLFLFVNI